MAYQLRSIRNLAGRATSTKQRAGRRYLRVREAIYFLSILLPTVGACLNLFTVGLLRRQYRGLVYNIWALLRSQYFTRRLIAPVALTSLVPAAEVDMRLCMQEWVMGNVSIYELLVLVELLRVHRPLACFEIGTFDGRTTLNMAANTPEETVIYTLDLPREQMNDTAFPLDLLDLNVVDKEISGARYRGRVWERKIRQLYGDSATFDYTPYEGKIDFIFIDGSHTYDYVVSDSLNAINLLRNGKGIILWHDYITWPTVQKAINFLHSTDRRFANTRFIEGTEFACLICE